MQYKSMRPAQAKSLLDGPEGWCYVDVRTVEEFQAGHPAGAYNVPYAVREASGRMAPNPDFVRVMKRAFPKDARLVIACAAGGRSLGACEMLAAEGYTNLVNMENGFSGGRDPAGRVEPGWQAAGYPCEAAAPVERTYAKLAAIR